MVDTGITSTAPVATAAPKKVWVKAKDEGKRPPLPVIAEEAKKDFAVKNWPLDSLEDVRSYALGEGNPVISKEVQKLTPEQRQLYIDTAQEVFLAHCNDRTKWRDDNPVRPANRGDARRRDRQIQGPPGWSAKPLNDIKTYVNKTGNRKIGGYLQKLDPAQKDAYLWTVTRVFAEACGLKLQSRAGRRPQGSGR